MTNTEPSPYGTFVAHCRKGELAYQVTDDGRAVFYPRAVSPGTGRPDLQWRVSKGLGIVYATTTLFPRTGSPYDVSLIDMDEGFRLMSRVENIDPLQVRIGMRVRVRIHPGEGDQPPYPVFDPAETGS